MNRFVAVLVVLHAALTSLEAAELEYSKIYKRDDTYIIDLSIVVDVPEAYARKILLDPDRFNQINEAVKEIEHLPVIAGSGRRFREKTSACALLFCVTYRNVVQLKENKDRTIEVNVEPQESDFAYGHVVWKTESTGQTNSRLSFHAESRPSFWLPPGLGSSVLGWQMEGIIIDAMREMECQYKSKASCPESVLESDEDDI